MCVRVCTQRLFESNTPTLSFVNVATSRGLPKCQMWSNGMRQGHVRIYAIPSSNAELQCNTEYLQLAVEKPRLDTASKYCTIWLKLQNSHQICEYSHNIIQGAYEGERERERERESQSYQTELRRSQYRCSGHCFCSRCHPGPSLDGLNFLISYQVHAHKLITQFQVPV